MPPGDLLGRRVRDELDGRSRPDAPNAPSSQTQPLPVVVFVSSRVSMEALVVEPSTIVSPSTTTVPVATAPRLLPWKWPVKPGNVVTLSVASIRPVPSQVRSTATVRPSRVVTVAVTAASCSDGEYVKSAGPEPRSLTRLPSQSKPRRRTVTKSLSSVLTPDCDSSSCPAITVTRVVAAVLGDDVVGGRVHLEAVERLGGRGRGSRNGESADEREQDREPARD